MDDLKTNVNAKQTLAPAATTDGTRTGATVDTVGYEGAMVHLDSGLWTDGSHVPTLEESDDNAAWSTVAAGDLNGSFTTIDGATDDNIIYTVGYKGKKRYLRVKVVSSGCTTGAVIGASILLTDPRYAGQNPFNSASL